MGEEHCPEGYFLLVDITVARLSACHFVGRRKRSRSSSLRLCISKCIPVRGYDVKPIENIVGYIPFLNEFLVLQNLINDLRGRGSSLAILLCGTLNCLHIFLEFVFLSFYQLLPSFHHAVRERTVAFLAHVLSAGKACTWLVTNTAVQVEECFAIRHTLG